MNAFFATIEGVRHVLAGIVIGVGVIGLAAGLIGEIRFPDFFTRLHASALCTFAGVLILCGLAIEAWEVQIAVRLILIAALLAVLAPVRTHLLANAAHGAGLAALIGRSAETPKEKA